MPVTINGSTGVTFPNSTLQASAAPGGGTTTTSAVDITLTATSTQVQYVSMTAVDKFVILPNATTLGEVSPAYTIINNGQYPFHVKNNAGDIVYYNLLQGETQTITLVDNATSSGVWANNTGLLNLGGGLPQVSSIAAVGDSYQNPAVAMLSATQALIFYCPTATQISVVLATISGTSVTYGTPTAILASGGNTQYFMRALRFNATTGIVFYYNNSSSFIRAVTVSGSTITLGTAATLASANANNTTASGYMAMLDTTTGFVGYAISTPAVPIRAFTVSGSTITLGGATNVSTDSSEFYGAAQIASGKVLFGYVNTSAYRARVCTNSGTTLTLGTQFTPTTAFSNAISSNCYEKIATDTATGIAYSGATGYVTVTIPVSGTTIGTVQSSVAGLGSSIPRTQIKYLSDGLQAAYVSYDNLRAYLSLFKGNANSGANAISQFNLGIYISLGTNPADMFGVIGGNKIIVVGVVNNFLTSQVVGVL
jgi:hypothetical protein